MIQDFSSRSYFISGAGKGLGAAIAKGLAECGAEVGIADIDEQALQETEGAIRAVGGKVTATTADLSEQKRFHEIVEAFAQRTGGLDGMINNASLLIYEPLESVEEETVDRMIGAGLKSVIWGSQALLKHRKPERQCVIVNFSSPVVYKGYPGTSIYSAIKAACAGLTRTLSAELGPKNIRVNAVAPASVPTPGALKYVDASEYARRSVTIPLRRLGEERDVVNAIRFLLSDEASFVNGAVLAADGGVIASA